MRVFCDGVPQAISFAEAKRQADEYADRYGDTFYVRPGIFDGYVITRVEPVNAWYIAQPSDGADHDDRETERAALAEAMSQATVRVYEQEEEEGIEHDWRPKL